LKPEDAVQAARPGLTLSTVKTALREWQGHMRRGALMPSEDEYAAALALVPVLPNPAAYLARTLRALADFCVSQGRLDDAASLFAQVAEGRGKKSEVFWRDYAGLLFRLALKRLAAGQVALANATFQEAAALLRGPADFPEVWTAAWNGYSETALWFERAGDALPAGLYAEHALAFAAKLGAWETAGAWLRKLAQTGRHRSGAPRALVWLRRMQELQAAWPEALNAAVQAAVGLAQAETSLGRVSGATEIFSEAETWLRQAGGESPALADLHLAWGLALGLGAGRAHLEEALSLRKRMLGPSHPRTHEAQQALLGLDTRIPVPADKTPRDWDGGLRFAEAAASMLPEGFQAGVPGDGAAGELKRLHRRLVRLCHPDTAPSGEAATWHELMVKVNLASEAGDLFTLRALLRETLARRAADRRTPA
jgi:hypothetical protein